MPVDPVLQTIGTEERPLQDEKPLRPAGEAREVVELAFDNDGASQPGLDLLAGITVDVGVIPVEPGGVIGGDLVGVIEDLIIRDVDEDVVAVALRRDVHAMDVQVGVSAAEVVDQPDFEAVAGAHAQGGPGNAPLVTHLAEAGGEVRERVQDGLQQAVPADTLGRLDPWGGVRYGRLALGSHRVAPEPHGAEAERAKPEARRAEQGSPAPVAR